MDMDKVKRKNKARFTNDEVEAMICAIEKHSLVLFGKFSGGITHAKKNRAWQDVTNSVNAVSAGPVRSVIDVQLKWKDHKKNSKIMLVEIRKVQKRTGSGVKPDDVDPFTERMAGLTGEASISGIPGGGLEFGFGKPKETATVPAHPPVSVTAPPVAVTVPAAPTVAVEAPAPLVPATTVAVPDVDIVLPVAETISIEADMGIDYVFTASTASQTVLTGNDHMAAIVEQGERLISVHKEQVQATNRLAAVLESLVRNVLEKEIPVQSE